MSKEGERARRESEQGGRVTEEGVQRKRVNQRRSRTVEKGEGKKEQVELGIVRREGRSSESKKIPG